MDQFLSENGINAETISKLTELDVTSVSDFYLLSSRNVDELDLPLQQKLKLKRLLRNNEAANPNAPGNTLPSTPTLPKYNYNDYYNPTRTAVSSRNNSLSSVKLRPGMFVDGENAPSKSTVPISTRTGPPSNRYLLKPKKARAAGNREGGADSGTIRNGGATTEANRSWEGQLGPRAGKEADPGDFDTVSLASTTMTDRDLLRETPDDIEASPRLELPPGRLAGLRKENLVKTSSTEDEDATTMEGPNLSFNRRQTLYSTLNEDYKSITNPDFTASFMYEEMGLPLAEHNGIPCLIIDLDRVDCMHTEGGCMYITPKRTQEMYDGRARFGFVTEITNQRILPSVTSEHQRRSSSSRQSTLHRSGQQKPPRPAHKVA